MVRSFRGTDAFSWHTTHECLKLETIQLTKFLPNTLCRSGFPLLECTCFLFNFKFFSAFIIQEIRIQHNKKWEGIAVNVHRKFLVKEKTNSMLYKWDSIALVFPLEFRDVYALIILEMRTQHKKKIVRNISECMKKNSRERKKNPCCRSGIPLLLSSL